MATDADIAFGRNAVAAGDITQEQLDDALALLHDLERAGSKKRLWDVLTQRGRLTAERAIELRAAARDQASAAHGAARRGPADRTVLEEASASRLMLVRIRRGQEPALYPIMHRPMSIGADPHADVVLDEAGVTAHHARLTSNGEGNVIWDVGSERGVQVNGRRITSGQVHPGDLIQLGDAMLLMIEGDEAGYAVEPTAPEAVGGAPRACLHVATGSRAGADFYVGERPLVIGRSRFCTLRLTDRDVTDFHAQITVDSTGGNIYDLHSSTGIEVSNKVVFRAPLADGAQLKIGDATLAYKQLASVSASPMRDTKPFELFARAPRPATDDEGDSRYELPDDVALKDDTEPGSEPDQRTQTVSINPVMADYHPGDLKLACLEGAVQGEVFPITREHMVIGRDLNAEIHVADASVSRRHATLTIANGKVIVRDLGSRNGIQVNGRQTEVAELKVGDTIRMGSCLLLVDWGRPLT